jgi:hypothetical protein
MTALALFALGCLLRCARAIPVPQAVAQPSAAASTADDATPAAGIKSPSKEPGDASAGILDEPIAASASPAAAGSSSVAEPTDPNVSQLNGMSTEQLAMYVGIGMSCCLIPYETPR